MIRSFKYFVFLFSFFLSFSLHSINSISYCVKSPSLIFAGETYNVIITINKNDITGSSKFEIAVPNGFIIEPVYTSGANFTFENNKGKFIWVVIPKTESVEISYNITVPYSYMGEKKIFRKFFYVDDNKIHEEGFYSTIKIIENDLLLNIKSTALISNNNIKFKIQVGAFTKQISPNYLPNNIINKYKIEEIYINNYFKYYVGDYNSLEEALKIKNSLTVKGAFITAYNNNERITIKDAIRILKEY